MKRMPEMEEKKRDKGRQGFFFLGLSCKILPPHLLFTSVSLRGAIAVLFLDVLPVSVCSSL